MTDVNEKKVGSCQPESPKRIDIQVQAYLQEQGEPIATQTDIPVQCDFQVQADIPLESVSIAVQTIKEEIRMPNIPNSVAQTPAKKRKLSSNLTSVQLDSATSTTNFTSVDVSQPAEPIQSGSGDQSSNERICIESNDDISSPPQSILDEPGDQSNTNRADTSVKVYDSILNTEVYQIYSREKDPEEAMKKIKELKNCIGFFPAESSFPTVKEFERQCKNTLGKLWKQKPQSGNSKFDKVKHFINDHVDDFEVLGNECDPKSMAGIFDQCLTLIKMLVPNGYEYWYVANFDKGHGSSKWYRAISSKRTSALRLAQLNVMGITNSTIDQLKYKDYLAKYSAKIKWLDFAKEIINRHRYNFLRRVDYSWYTGLFHL